MTPTTARPIGHFTMLVRQVGRAPFLAGALAVAGLVLACTPAIQAGGTSIDAEAAAETASSGDTVVLPLADVDSADSGAGSNEVSGDAAVADVPSCTTDGGPRCPCNTNVDCDSGLCIDYADSKRCAVPCTTDAACLADENCVQSTSGGDVAQFCAPRFAALCAPCQEDADCRAGVYAGTPTCHSAGPAGSFCTVPCTDTTQCPEGFACAGQPGFCAPAQGACGCSGWAVAHNATTKCTLSNTFGDCWAKRTCINLGALPACTAVAATAEVCNGQDDNCNGLTDDGADSSCNDSDACTSDICAGGQCVHPSVVNCGDGNCAMDCGESTGNCPVDCHICGDGLCQPGEGPKSCPGDCCGVCGDGKCVGYECGEDKAGGPKQCILDCGTACGNQACDKGESPSTCPADCSKQVCGNHVCEPGDGGPTACPQDCAPSCGNCLCEKGESGDDCPGDCGVCGDEVCSLCDGLGESPAKCPVDCPIKPACTLWPGLCNDGSPCTTDSCVDGKGCTHTAVGGAPCDDGSVCTLGDVCGADGVCAGTGLDCNDANVCTADSCDSNGCQHQPSAGDCSDQDACTQGDTCQAGACVAGPLNTCFDNNPCTDSVCLGGVCQYGPASGPCTDNNPCTGPDVCADGKCTPGALTNCDDNQVCTTDSCNSAGQCEHAALTVECSDGDACTVGDTCSNGACKAGPVNDCNDGNACTTGSCVSGKCAQSNINCADTNPCTADACDPNTGCTHANLGTSASCGTGLWCNGAGVCGVCNAAVPCPDQSPGTVTCTASATCACTPASAAAVCGTAKCGSKAAGCGKTVSCGTCSSGQTCSTGVCTATCVPCSATMTSLCKKQGLKCCDNACQ